MTKLRRRTYDGIKAGAIVRRKGEAALGLFRSLAIGLFIVAIPVALITTNVRVAISELRVYDYSVRTYDAASRSGVPESELLRADTTLRRYLTTRDPGPLTINVADNQGRIVPLFTARETAHMADVHDLVQAMFTLQVLAVETVLSLSVLMLWLWPPRALAAAALYGSVLTAAVLGMTAFVAVTGGFNSAWSQFHGVVFSNDLWRLDPRTDHLIQMFPEAFWQRITTLLGAFTLLESVVIGVLSGTYLVLTRSTASAPEVVSEPVVTGPGELTGTRSAPPDSPRYVH